MQAGEKDKPVSDQWLDPFVIVDKNDKPVGTVEVLPPPPLPPSPPPCLASTKFVDPSRASGLLSESLRRFETKYEGHKGRRSLVTGKMSAVAAATGREHQHIVDW